MTNTMSKARIISELREAIAQNERLRPLTKKTYNSRVNQIEKSDAFPLKKNTDISDLVEALNPRDNLSTEYSVVVTLQIFSRMSPLFKKALGGNEVQDDLRVLAEELGDEKRKEQHETREDDVSWEYLQGLSYGDKDLTRQEQLVVDLYIKPGVHVDAGQVVPRADFTPAKIVDKEEDMTDEDMNYVLLDTEKPFIRLNAYKTAHRFGPRDLYLPKEIVAKIPKRNEYLFQGHNGDPLTDNAFQKMSQRALTKLTDGKKKLGITKIRRAYAQHISKHMDTKTRSKLAHAMGHSTATSRAYAQEEA